MPIQIMKLKDKKSPSFKDKILKASAELPTVAEETAKSAVKGAGTIAVNSTKKFLKAASKKSNSTAIRKNPAILVGFAAAAVFGATAEYIMDKNDDTK